MFRLTDQGFKSETKRNNLSSKKKVIKSILTYHAYINTSKIAKAF